MRAGGDGLREDGGASTAARVLVAGAILLAAVVVAIVLFAGDGGYRVTADFVNAGQLVKGSEVRVAGSTVGTVEDIEVTNSGTAEVTFTVDDDYAPLRRGTQVTVKPTSLSGIANRFIDLQLGPDSGADIEDGGHIGSDQTATAVELDEVFSLFDKETRSSLRGFIKGQADTLRGRGAELRKGIHYLNPALSTGSRVFRELTRDEPLLKRFVVDSATLVNALAERRDDTTFVNLRAALDDVDPLVDAAKPAVRRLGPFLDQARLFARDGEPTIRDLSRTIRAAGSSNDLIELINSFPPLSRVALDDQTVNGAERRGAFPETTAALSAAAPTIAFGRPYTPDFVGWLDDFSTTGGYDAVGGYSRAWINLSELLYGPGPKTDQFRRCPGANEEPAPDGSNVLTAAETAALDCDPSQRSVGP
jgi:phospholipid/cholesterol/gamma-HCH transport system substrate-binding protein